jgi:DNA-binding IclR family transcriptional regulator
VTVAQRARASVVPKPEPRQLAGAEAIVDSQTVTALARGLRILRCFGAGDHWLGNLDMAERTGLAKPTVSRLARTLTRLGYLHYSASLKKYALGPGVLSLGLTALGQMDVRRIARPLMQSLAERTHVCVNLAVNDGLSMVYVDRYQLASSYAVQVDVGSRLPIANTSVGRAFLCGLAERERGALMDELRAAHAGEWPRLRKGIERALRDYQDHGYCASIGDWRQEVHAIAAPLVRGDESAPIVFSCSGPAFELTAEALERDVGPRLVALVGNVAHALEGARGS